VYAQPTTEAAEVIQATFPFYQLEFRVRGMGVERYLTPHVGIADVAAEQASVVVV
jgi:hypothetical protein